MMRTTLTRREAALLGWMLRQLLNAAGDGVTGQNLPELLRIWNAGVKEDDPETAAVAQRVLGLVKEWPVNLRTALLQERCRLRPLDDDLLCLEPEAAEAPAGRATA